MLNIRKMFADPLLFFTTSKPSLGFIGEKSSGQQEMRSKVNVLAGWRLKEGHWSSLVNHASRTRPPELQQFPRVPICFAKKKISQNRRCCCEEHQMLNQVHHLGEKKKQEAPLVISPELFFLSHKLQLGLRC